MGITSKFVLCRIFIFEIVAKNIHYLQIGQKRNFFSENSIVSFKITALVRESIVIKNSSNGSRKVAGLILTQSKSEAMPNP
jgi:hypothetical protein